jgi:hypothetical protein
MAINRLCVQVNENWRHGLLACKDTPIINVSGMTWNFFLANGIDNVDELHVEID